MVRVIFAITGLVLAVQQLVAAQDATYSAPPPDVVQAIGDLERRLNTGLVQRDRAVLASLIADPFTFVHGLTGSVQSREEWLAASVQGTATGAQRGARSEHGVSYAAYGGATPHTVLRTARVVLHDAARKTEEWVQQVRVFIRGSDGQWRLASVQGTLLYEGPVVDRALYARYQGTYRISAESVLTMTWEDETLFARLPNGVKTPVFLDSPTAEVLRSPRLGRFRFTLGSDGRPTTVALIRDDMEVWRASRTSP